MAEKKTGLVFLSGGSALKELSSKMAASGLHGTHVISAFDNGGSSRLLRETFRCIAVGDIRNRLTALSHPPASSSSRRLLALFRERLDDDKPRPLLRQKVDALARGSSSSLDGISAQHKKEIAAALAAFLSRIPEKFDWRHGSVGNFVLVGKYLVENSDWTAALDWAHGILRCVGSVYPVTTTSAHLGAELAHGRTVVGQKALTAQDPPIEQPVKQLRLLKSDKNYVDRVHAVAYRPALQAIAGASAVVYSWGSFYTSVLPALLVAGVPAAVLERDVPRILLLNPVRDSELLGMTPYDVVQTLNTYAAAGGAAPRPAVSHVIAIRPRNPSRDSFYDAGSLARLEREGVQVVTVDGEDLPEGPEIEKIIALLLGVAGVS